MRFWFRFLVLLPSLLFSFKVFAAVPLELRGAIQHAMEHSPTLNTAKKELEIAKLNKENATARFLPSLDLTSSHGLQDDALNPAANKWASSFDLSITETLYDNGQNVTNYQITKLKHKKAATAYSRQRDQTCLSVAKEFYKFSLAQQIVEIEESQLALLQKQFKTISSHYRQGLKTRKDYLRFRTQVRRAEINLLGAKNSIEKSKEELKRIIGTPLDKYGSVNFSPHKPGKEISVPQSSPQIKKHFVFREANFQREIDKLTVSLSKRLNLPRLTLSSGLNYASSSYMGPGAGTLEDNDQLSWNVLVGLSYNIVDWGTRKRDISIARKKQIISSNNLRGQLLSTETQIRQLMLDLGQLEESFKLSRELLTLEKSSFDFLESEYRQGKSTYLDLITGLDSYADAQKKYYNAYFNLKTKIADYHYHNGELYDSIFN